MTYLIVQKVRSLERHGPIQITRFALVAFQSQSFHVILKSVRLGGSVDADVRPLAVLSVSRWIRITARIYADAGVDLLLLTLLLRFLVVTSLGGVCYVKRMKSTKNKVSTLLKLNDLRVYIERSKWYLAGFVSSAPPSTMNVYVCPLSTVISGISMSFMYQQMPQDGWPVIGV